MPPDPGHRIDWDEIVERMYSRVDSPDRRRAQWLACREVLSNLDAYRPIECTVRPPVLDTILPDDIRQHAMRADVEKSPVSVRIVEAFVSWRLHVTDVEAMNAARLLMLASTLRSLADLHSKSTQPELVLARIGDLGRFIEYAWGLAIPLSGGLRAWSHNITLRYDLLSIDWREL